MNGELAYVVLKFLTQISNYVINVYFENLFFFCELTQADVPPGSDVGPILYSTHMTSSSYQGHTMT